MVGWRDFRHLRIEIICRIQVENATFFPKSGYILYIDKPNDTPFFGGPGVPKPMDIVSESDNIVKLRGYAAQARTPFGWQTEDLSDTGLSVHFANGKIVKCVFHMFNKNVDIEYLP